MKRVFVVALLASCYHSHHTTHVRRGWHASIEGGVSKVTPQKGVEDRPRTVGVDVLGTLGYGWRFDRIGLLAQLTIPPSRYYADATPSQEASPPGVEVFLQRDGDVLSYGAGVVVGLQPLVYAQAGKWFAIDRCNAYSLDAGVGTTRALNETGATLNVFALATRTLAGIDLSVWVDAIQYPAHHFYGCDDCFEDNFTRRHLSAGLAIRGVSPWLDKH